VKVLQLISSGGFYGAENMLLQLARALENLQCKSIIGVFRNAHRRNEEIADNARRYGLEVELFDCRGRFDPRTAHAIRDCVARRNVDIVHTHGYKADIYGYWATRRARVPLVATCHNWPAQTISLNFYAALDRLLLRRFDHMGAVSEAVVHALRRYGVPPRKITMIPNGIDVEQFAGAGSLLRKQLGAQDRIVIGVAGRLSPEKGLKILFHAAQAVVASVPEVLFVLAGEGPDGAALEKLTKELSIGEHVAFLGKVSRMMDFYASIDALVMPSLTEGLPLSLLEAMAAGKPVVASRVGSVPSVIIAGETGLLVEPSDVAGLRDAILYLLKDRERALAWGRNGQERVRRHFSSANMAQNYLDIYSDAISAKAAFPIVVPAATKQN
jgi:glycosyltransferase involved in cell wall biosynthesis